MTFIECGAVQDFQPSMAIESAGIVLTNDFSDRLSDRCSFFKFYMSDFNAFVRTGHVVVHYVETTVIHF